MSQAQLTRAMADEFQAQADEAAESGNAALARVYAGAAERWRETAAEQEAAENADDGLTRPS